MIRFLLASLLAFGGAAHAHAQAALGAPVSADFNAEQPTDPTNTRPQRPVVGYFQPTGPDVARMIAVGGNSPAEISAAKIKNEEGQLVARRAAVQYLATVDCHYYPEAETGLIAALRADRNESVRYEAAVALASARALTDRVLDALNVAALGLDVDGNPAESSERVRHAARSSLFQCMNRGLCLPPLATQSALTPPAMIQQASYAVPAPVTHTTPQERAAAETVGVTPKTAAPAPTMRRTLWQILGLTSHRDADSQVDPRLRGLVPLNSEPVLAIPTTPTYPASYNNQH